MADVRDFRVTMSITLPPETEKYATEIRQALTPFLKWGVVINESKENEERGFIQVERNGHRVGKECTVLARWEVGKGQVI